MSAVALEVGDFVTVGEGVLVWQVESVHASKMYPESPYYVIKSGQSNHTRRGHLNNLHLYMKRINA